MSPRPSQLCVVLPSNLSVLVIDVEQIVSPRLDTEAAKRIELGVVQLVVQVVAGSGRLQPPITVPGELVDVVLEAVDAVPVVIACEEVADHQPVSEGFVLSQLLMLILRNPERARWR